MLPNNDPALIRREAPQRRSIIVFSGDAVPDICVAPLPVLPTISQWPTTSLLVRSGRAERMGPSIPLRLLRHGYTPRLPTGVSDLFPRGWRSSSRSAAHAEHDLAAFSVPPA